VNDAESFLTATGNLGSIQRPAFPLQNGPSVETDIVALIMRPNCAPNGTRRMVHGDPGRVCAVHPCKGHVNKSTALRSEEARRAAQAAAGPPKIAQLPLVAVQVHCHCADSDAGCRHQILALSGIFFKGDIDRDETRADHTS
jgi:hypothetical protein